MELQEKTSPWLNFDLIVTAEAEEFVIYLVDLIILLSGIDMAYGQEWVSPFWLYIAAVQRSDAASSAVQFIN